MLVLRPRPVFEAAKAALLRIGGPATLVSVALAVGIITVDQADALTNVFVASLPAVQAIGHVLVAFRMVSNAEPQTTPLSSPVSAEGVPLVPLTPAASGSSETGSQGGTGLPLAPDLNRPGT